MANTGSDSGDIFDIKRIRRLVKLMEEHDLGEIDLAQGEQSIRLRRGSEGVVRTTVSPAPAPAAEAPATADDANTAYVKSPMVGTFYVAASPDTPPYVKVGDPVGADTIVCIIEAMKVFNEIPAEVAGKIVSVLVANGDPVEFGQPLFKLDTSI